VHRKRIREYINWARVECVCSIEAVAALTLAVGSDYFKKCKLEVFKN